MKILEFKEEELN